MELVKLLNGEYYVVDFDSNGQPAFAAGPVPQEVLEVFTGSDEDENFMEGYFCYYAQGDPDETARWLEGQKYVVLTVKQRAQVFPRVEG